MKKASPKRGFVENHYLSNEITAADASLGIGLHHGLCAC